MRVVFLTFHALRFDAAKVQNCEERIRLGIQKWRKRNFASSLLIADEYPQPKFIKSTNGPEIYSIH